MEQKTLMEIVGGLTGAVVGSFLAYHYGTPAVDYIVDSVQKVSLNPPELIKYIAQHEDVTKFIGCTVGGFYGAKTGASVGSLSDVIAGTDKQGGLK